MLFHCMCSYYEIYNLWVKFSVEKKNIISFFDFNFSSQHIQKRCLQSQLFVLLFSEIVNNKQEINSVCYVPHTHTCLHTGAMLYNKYFNLNFHQYLSFFIFETCFYSIKFLLSLFVYLGNILFIDLFYAQHILCCYLFHTHSTTKFIQHSHCLSI